METSNSEQPIEKSHGQGENLKRRRNPNGGRFTWENEEQIICDTCGTAIAPGDLNFHTRSAIGPLMKLCARCCAQEEPILCDRCGTLILPGVIPHLHMAGLPAPFLRRLCKKCWRAMNAVIYDELLEQDGLWTS